MKICVIGLGRMGHAVAFRLISGGHEVWGFDTDSNNLKLASGIGVKVVFAVQELAQHASIFWLMIPAGDAVDSVINQLINVLKPGDILVDGGNSHFHDSVRRYKMLKEKQINFVDCGTSGGVQGKELGFSLMIGCDKNVFDKLEPIFKVLATSGGYAYMGPAGAGHYVKMVHNGIEYALLQSYAEGFHLLKEGEYKDLDLAKVCDVWNHGSIIRSWILDLSHNVFIKDQNFSDISGQIGENKTGRWTIDEAKNKYVPVDLIERALEIRALSRKTGGNYATKIVALLRNQFGGHPFKKNGEE
ncbi:MAG: 6-phosphogluconate dehydrogenase (Decarboxylating) [candidate division TM6 bacterium GW2011_GWF2_37_49]|nr:MAG: 6-phosphogluconate dehydrogenase (Decarboxylating) [candidate division TM6 bacterium GW2011_GWF2_37_49]